MNEFITIEEALDEIRQGRMVILLDDESRENEGDLVMAAEKITPETMNFMIKHGRGLLHLTLTEERVNQLHIPLMPERRKHLNQAPFTTSIEAAEGVTTGASVHDRVRTIQVTINPQSTFEDITMPGHVFPLQARRGGVLERPGHTEGSVDLARLAGFQPAGILCEILRDDGYMARFQDLREFSQQHQIKLVSINDLIAYRLCHERIVSEIAVADLPLAQNKNVKIHIFCDEISGIEHVALVSGELDLSKPTLVRIHSECLTGDAFGSQRCDCGSQLQQSIQQIEEQAGVLIYMRQEGRGIGLGNKIKAYMLQTEGLDTVEANLHLGFPADQRSYGISAQILHALGIKQIRLLTNNPNKIRDMERFGIKVQERVPLETIPNEKNMSYLKAKRDKLGHWLNVL